MKSLKDEHPEDEFLFIDNPKEHQFVNPGAPMTLVKTTSSNKKEIFVDILGAIKKFKFSLKDIHLIFDDEDLKAQVKLIRYTCMVMYFIHCSFVSDFTSIILIQKLEDCTTWIN